MTRTPDPRPPATVDLTNCDREPIHIPGRIQPHGVLFALDEPGYEIRQVSDNTGPVFGVPASEMLGRPLTDFLPEGDALALVEAVRQQTADDAPATFVARVRTGFVARDVMEGDAVEGAAERVWDVIAHRRGGVLIVELEPTPPMTLHDPRSTTQYPLPTTPDTYALARQAVTRIQAAPTFDALFETVAKQVRRVNGFDRVMVYQFDADGHGTVIAEDCRPDMEPFLGLHYPATDIPAQARRLYTLNLLRLIADVNYAPVDVIPTDHPATGQPLDMSFGVLRSVSPIHVQYLKNMGVSASMSISIVQDGELWGLIACHHDAPRFVPYDVRTACEFIGQVVALQVANRRKSEALTAQVRYKSVQADLITQMAGETRFYEGLTRGPVTLLDFLDAGGAATVTRDGVETLGATPDRAFLRGLAGWLGEGSDGREASLFATHQLSAVYPPAAAVTDVASGLLAVPLPPHAGEYLLWFRPEIVQTVNWAGDPNKPVEVGADGAARLTPRGSFALWKENVRARSARWTDAEVAAVRDLQRAIVGLVLHRVSQLEALNAQLEASNAELNAFTYIASHDLREPIRGIRNYAQFLREDVGDALTGEGREHLATLLHMTERMEALIDSLLRYSRVGQQELYIEPADLNLVLAEKVRILGPRLTETGTRVRIPRPLPTVPCDALQVGEVFANLLTNAVKYNDKPERWIEVGYLEGAEARRVLAATAEGVPADAASASSAAAEPTPTVFYVRDNGIGIREKHMDTIFQIFRRLHGRDAYGGGTGAGLTIARKLVERHGGRLWASSVWGEGTSFYFTLEKGPSDDA